ncbi:MAG: oxidoreductase [Caldilineaceae bacterium]
MSTHCKSVFIVAPFQIEVRKQPIPHPAANQVLVQTLVSAISPGTEMLFYRGQIPPDMHADSTLPGLSQVVSYPLQYGYACVGRVAAVGANVATDWLDQLVFAFQPHQSHFVTEPPQLLKVPANLTPEQAALLPNMETAVNFAMDGRPSIGERVAIFGQGIVGLLTTSLLSQYPLAALTVLDRYELRRACAVQGGATQAFDPLNMTAQLCDRHLRDYDLVYELSGSPAALDQAIACAGFGGRVIIGSWYCEKRADLHLGGAFHRSRIQLSSSQVSTIGAEWSARWDKARRLDVAWRMLAQLDYQRLITHRFHVEQAAAAYALIDQQPQQAIQVLLTYE